MTILNIVKYNLINQSLYSKCLRYLQNKREFAFII